LLDAPTPPPSPSPPVLVADEGEEEGETERERECGTEGMSTLGRRSQTISILSSVVVVVVVLGCGVWIGEERRGK